MPPTEGFKPLMRRNHFSRHRLLLTAQYTGERPELISPWHAVATRVRGRRRHGEKSMKAKQQRKITMKRLSITFGTLLLVLGCFGLSSTVQAAGRNPIVGLWSVHYVSTTGGPEAFAYIQWHNDGLEFEVAGFAPGAMCQGTFKQAPDGSYHDYHIAWTFDSTGAPSG